MNALKTIILTALAFALLAVPVRAEKRSGDNFKEKIGLTEEQTEQLRKLRLDHQKEMIQLHADLKKKQLDLKELWRAKELDGSKIKSLTKELGKLQQEKLMARVEQRLAHAEILTEEQREKIREHRGNRFKEGRHHGRRDGRGFRGRSHSWHNQGEGKDPGERGDQGGSGSKGKWQEGFGHGPRHRGGYHREGSEMGAQDSEDAPFGFFPPGPFFDDDFAFGDEDTNLFKEALGKQE